MSTIYGEGYVADMGCAAHGQAHPCEVCAAEMQLEQMRQDGNADDIQEATVHLAAVEHAHGVDSSRGGER